MVLISNLVMQKNRGSIIDRDQDIHRAIVIKISDGHPTGGKRLSEQRAALRTYILETFASVAEQHERFLVFHLAVQTLDEVIVIAVGQEQIQTAISISFGRHYSTILPRIFSNARGFADIDERAIAIIVKQPTRHGLIETRNAVSMLPFLARTTRFVQGLRELDKLADKQVEPPIVVIIEPHCARRPSRSRNPGSLRDISESAIAIVVIQNASAILRNVQVG